MKTLIKNVRIVTPHEIKHGKALLLEDDEIIGFVNSEDYENVEDINIVDGEGEYLSPGFIDIHNHGNSNRDVMDANEHSLDIMGDYHIKNGVTSYLGTVITSSYEEIERAIENITEYKNKEDRARLVGIHLEGPYFNIDKKGAQPEKYIKLPDIDELGVVVDKSKGLLKMVSMAPELDKAEESIKYLVDKGIVVAMAHTNAKYEEAKKGIESGATVATHIFNGMRNFSHREPGVVGASLTDDRVFCEMICDRYHLHDAAMELVLRAKGVEKVILVSDAMRAAGLEDGEYDLGGQTVYVKDGLTRLESGSIAGSTLNLNVAVRNVVRYLDISIKDAVRMASLNPATAMGLKDIGSIEIGKKADLLFFDENINISKVVLGGKIVWKKN